MPKVMVSLPETLLARIDAEAEQSGNSRSGVLRALAESALRSRERQLQDRMAALDGEARSHGGDVTSVLKAHRPR